MRSISKNLGIYKEVIDPDEHYGICKNCEHCYIEQFYFFFEANCFLDWNGTECIDFDHYQKRKDV